MFIFGTVVILTALRVTALSHAAAPVLVPVPSASPGSVAEFVNDIERDFPLRSIGQLQITNMRGAVTVQGWAQDKIRVRARRRVSASTEAEAQKLFSTIDFRFKSADGNIELSAEYGKGLEIGDRVRERESPHTSMEMIILAPSNLKLKVWTVDDHVSVKGWSESLMIRSNRGGVQVEGSKGKETAVLCDSCSINMHAIRGSVRSMSADGGVSLSDVIGSQIYVESGSGAIDVGEISGDQLYVTKTGAISGHSLKGNVEFHTHQGAVDIDEASGFLSGSTESGAIKARMKEWKFTDKALIESADGAIQLSLPPTFSGELDVWSAKGKVELAFPLKKLPGPDVMGPEAPNHFSGEVGDGGERLKVYSERGDVRVMKTM